MLGSPFYPSAIRKIVSVFGALFNDIHVLRIDNLDVQQNDIKVPLSYAPKQSWYRKLTADMGGNEPNVSMTLPRMSFEMTGLLPDPDRQISQLGYKTVDHATDASLRRVQRNEIPYDFGFDLNIAAKNIEDNLQIIEQILPFFQPDFNVPIEFDTEFNITKDVSFVLDSVTPEDNYTEGFTDNRLIVWTLSFTVKGWLFPPVADLKAIKTVITKIASSIDENSEYNFDSEQTTSVNPGTAAKEDTWTIDRTNTEL